MHQRSLTTDEIAPPPPRAVATTTDEIALYGDVAKHIELAIAQAFLRHSVVFVLPPLYRPDEMGEMRFVGVETKKLIKTKAGLIVKFLTPQSLKDITMQIYCTSLELKHGLCQGDDLSIVTAIKYTIPQAKSLYDIGVGIMSAADISRANVGWFQ